MNDFLNDISDLNSKFEQKKALILICIIPCLIGLFCHRIYQTNDEKINVIYVYQSEEVQIEVKPNSSVKELFSMMSVEYSDTDYLKINDNYMEISKTRSYYLTAGDKVELLKVEISYEIVSEAIAYDTQENENNTLYAGEKKTTQIGVEGVKEIKYEIRSFEGKVSKTKVEETVVKTPVPEKIEIGTKSRPSNNANNSNSTSSNQSNGSNSSTGSNNNNGSNSSNDSTSNNANNNSNNSSYDGTTNNGSNSSNDTNSNCTITINGVAHSCNN